MAVVRRQAGELAQAIGHDLPIIDHRDIAAEAGLDFHHSPSARLGPEFIVEVIGSGAALIEFDNDGPQDVSLVIQPRWAGRPETAHSRLYRNLGRLQFGDWTQRGD